MELIVARKWIIGPKIGIPLLFKHISWFLGSGAFGEIYLGLILLVILLIIIIIYR